MIKNIALAMTLATAASVSAPSLVSAKSVDNPNKVNVETKDAKNSQLSQELIEKASPFVKTTETGFYISEEGYSYLNSDEIKVVSSYIDTTNKNLDEISKSMELFRKEDSFVHQRRFARDTSGYVNVQYMWWGAQIYFSHQAVTDLNDYFTLSGLAAGAAGESVGKFLTKHGLNVSTKFLGPISLYGTGVAWAMGKLDEGNGVYLNCILYVPCTITTP